MKYNYVMALMFAAATLAISSPSYGQTCSTSLTNNVGDTISVTAALSTTDPDENCEGEPLLVSPTGGEFAGVINNYFIPQNFTYTATAANETITGTNLGFDSDESCSVIGAITKSPLLTPDQKNFFTGLAAGLGLPAVGFATVGGLCTVGVITGPICGLPGVILSSVFAGGAALAAAIAADPSDPNFTQIVVVTNPNVPLAGQTPGVPQAVINSWNIVLTDGAQLIGYEAALYTTLNRAAGARDAGNSFWLTEQLNEATLLEGQLVRRLSALATDLTTLQNALQAAGIDATLTASQVLQFEQQVAFGGIPASELSLLQSFDSDPSFLSAAKGLLFVQDINAVAGNVSNLLAPPTLTSLLNGFMVGPPTNKDQCNNGGWQAFNVPHAFKNQGACIQFANTGK